jgi:hypothetical protein
MCPVLDHQHKPTPLTRDCRKIPWRLSAPQKLRQRRRLRRVDNIVSVLDSALQRQVQTQPATTATKGIGATQATTEELAQTAQGQRLMNAEVNTPLNDRRHGRGPRQGEILSGSLPMGTVTMTGDQARKMGTIKLIERWKAEMPTEAEMLPRDKYTMFDRKEKKYRKGIHSKSPPVPPSEHSSLTDHISPRAAQVDQSLSTCQPSWFLDHLLTLSVYSMHRAAFGLWLVSGFVQKYYVKECCHVCFFIIMIPMAPSYYLKPASCVCGQRSYCPLVAFVLPSCGVALR